MNVFLVESFAVCVAWVDSETMGVKLETALVSSYATSSAASIAASSSLSSASSATIVSVFNLLGNVLGGNECELSGGKVST